MQSIGGKRLVEYIYVGHYAYLEPNKVSRVNPTTFSFKDDIEIPLAYEYYIYALVKDGNFLYVCDEGGHVTKVDTVSWSIADELTLNPGEEYIRDACKVENYLYLAIRTSPGIIVKVDLSTFSRVGALTLASGENNPNGIASDGQFLYAACGTTPCKIVKIDIETFSRVGVLTLNGAPEYEYYGGRMAVYGGKLYVPCGYYYPATEIDVTRLVKVDLSTFTREASLLLATNSGGGAASCVSEVKDNYIYVSPTAIQRIYKVNIVDFTLVSYLDLIVRSNNNLHIHGNYLYCQNSNYSEAAKIEVIDLETFTSLGTIVTYAYEYALSLSITS
jgi:hypothetical protein